MYKCFREFPIVTFLCTCHGFCRYQMLKYKLLCVINVLYISRQGKKHFLNKVYLNMIIKIIIQCSVQMAYEYLSIINIFEQPYIHEPLERVNSLFWHQ